MRPPRKAPFPVGTRLRCVARRRGVVHALVGDQRILIFGPGLEVAVTEVREGHRGTGRQLVDEDGPMTYEDTGEPIVDETRDGYSVYEVAGQGRIIWPADRREWEVIK